MKSATDSSRMSALISSANSGTCSARIPASNSVPKSASDSNGRPPAGGFDLALFANPVGSNQWLAEALSLASVSLGFLKATESHQLDRLESTLSGSSQLLEPDVQERPPSADSKSCAFDGPLQAVVRQLHASKRMVRLATIPVFGIRLRRICVIVMK